MMAVQMLWNGRMVDVSHIEHYDFSPLELAHPIARINRYAGNTRNTYSVAEHSVLLATAVPAHLRKVALIHDMSEAFTGDIPWPVKQLLPEVCALEDRIQRHLCRIWDVDWIHMEELAPYDRRKVLRQHAPLATGRCDIQKQLTRMYPYFISNSNNTNYVINNSIEHEIVCHMAFGCARGLNQCRNCALARNHIRTI